MIRARRPLFVGAETLYPRALSLENLIAMCARYVITSPADAIRAMFG